MASLTSRSDCVRLLSKQVLVPAPYPLHIKKFLKVDEIEVRRVVFEGGALRISRLCDAANRRLSHANGEEIGVDAMVVCKVRNHRVA